MEKIKVNDVDCYESIMVILDEKKYPIAHQNKVDELIECGAFESVAEAKEWVNTTPIELELYYEKKAGLFAVESDAIECYGDCLCSPYTKAKFDADLSK